MNPQDLGLDVGASRSDIIQRMVELALLSMGEGVADTSTNCISSVYNAPVGNWLPQPDSSKYESKQHLGLFELLKSNTGAPGIVFNLLELSITSILANKFHTMNLTKLIHDDKDSSFPLNFHYLATSTWFTLYCETFGLKYLNHLHTQQENLNKVIAIKEYVKKVKPSCDFLTNISGTLESIGKCTKISSILPLETKDCATEAIEFILEPRVLVQLPWNSVMYQQWLLTALGEVNKFEKFTLELRTWALNPQIEPIARELVSMVRELKERIYLGYTILCIQIVKYPQIDVQHPKWILDNVVLPSLVPLEMINNPNKGHALLKSIKKLSWGQSVTRTSDGVYISENAFKVNEKLETVFNSMFCSFSFWYDFPLGPLDVNTDYSSIDLQELINEINITRDMTPSTEKIFQISKIESQLIEKFMEYKKKSNLPTLNIQDLKNNTIKTIEENIFNKNRLQKKGWDKAKESIQKCKIVDIDSLMQKELTEMSTEEKCIIFSLMYKQIHQTLSGTEREDGMLPRTIALEQELVDRELILKLTELLSEKMKLTPVDINVKKYKLPTLEIAKMMEILGEIQTEKRDREWLWSKFPESWKEAVNIDEKEMKFEYNISNIIQEFENRIGRIVYNTAFKYHEIFENDGKIFPHLNTVQYILPSILASFISDTNTLNPCKNEHKNIKSHYIKFLHHLIQYYEISYQNWSSNNIGKPKDTRLLDDILQIETYAVYNEMKSLLAHSNILLNSFLNTEVPNTTDNLSMHKFEMLKHASLAWYSELEDNTEEQIPVLQFLYTWNMKSLGIINTINRVVCQIWAPVIQESFKIHPEIKSMHHISLLLSFCEIVFTRFLLYFEKLPEGATNTLQLLRVAPLASNLDQNTIEVLRWRYKFYFAIAKAHSGSKSKKIITKIIDNGKTLLSKDYKFFKSMRENMGPNQMPSLHGLPLEIKELVLMFFNRDFKNLEIKLPLLTLPTRGVAQQRQDRDDAKTTLSVKEVESKVEIPGSKFAIQSQATGTNNKCRNCPKVEKMLGLFLVCEKCLEEKFEDVNYFCSVKCQKEWWAKQHKEEHVNQLLGLKKSNDK